jgi:NADPH:quinone reductase-like Zn-dependent oxidoreductase
MPNMSDTSINAVVVDPNAAGRLVIRPVPPPQVYPGQLLVRVKAISLNPGELRMSQNAAAGHRPGWDFSGVVERAADNGTGPAVGARVVGMLRAGSWAQLIAAPTNAVAQIPQNVSFTQAAALPVAGLAALYSLRKGGLLLDKLVLVTGPTGGTGIFACQLARLGGARVVATVRSPQREAFVRSLGVEHVVVGEDPSAAAKFGPYALIIDSVGGPNFGKVLAMLATGGTCVILGASAGTETQIDLRDFYSGGPKILYGLIIFQELAREPASQGLKVLAELVAAGKLKPHIDVEVPWTRIAEIAKDLTDRKFTGKAVLTVD